MVMNAMSKTIPVANTCGTFWTDCVLGVALGWSLIGAFILGVILFFTFKPLFIRPLYGFIDRTGDFVINPQYDGISHPHWDGKAVMAVWKNPLKHTSGYFRYTIDKKGTILSTGFKARCSPCKMPNYGLRADEGDYLMKSLEPEQLVPLQSEKGLWGYKKQKDKDKLGHWVVEPQHPSATYFDQHGLAWVKKFKPFWHKLYDLDFDMEKEYGLINEQGEDIVKPRCLRVVDFHEGLAACQVTVYFGKYY